MKIVLEGVLYGVVFDFLCFVTVENGITRRQTMLNC